MPTALTGEAPLQFRLRVWVSRSSRHQQRIGVSRRRRRSRQPWLAREDSGRGDNEEDGAHDTENVEYSDREKVAATKAALAAKWGLRRTARKLSACVLTVYRIRATEGGID